MSSRVGRRSATSSTGTPVCAITSVTADRSCASPGAGIEMVPPFRIEAAVEEPASSALRKRREAGVVGGHHVDPMVADLRLQLGRGAGRDRPPVVDEHDPVGQLVGLLQVLGREHAR